MTDRDELNNLTAKARSKGATVEVEHDEGGYPIRFTVSGLKGVGPFPMAALSFAERMREVLR
jgi:hypothetical protein